MIEKKPTRTVKKQFVAADKWIGLVKKAGPWVAPSVVSFVFDMSRVKNNSTEKSEDLK